MPKVRCTSRVSPHSARVGAIRGRLYGVSLGVLRCIVKRHYARRAGGCHWALYRDKMSGQLSAKKLAALGFRLRRKTETQYRRR